ncbi:hypothetical protein TraAM80_01147 [Trypanosoma rangeli]|uniref:Uncharacterized protein n=1 Tax=Trypanosoma rangeli TaxID=5698 RepID=A0A3R7KPH0_TRYRA|nr:uncharacterized protein TraAM80_01147 [Trypanosoma rangeli]RNF11020.1 hypothetical protein TraAM80_01147 [Trypanosoma rangeli]|eukprot:RNF11020.1 hypothetical protein TraAM80_01147 [Trypanosoma rangeli]
MPRVDQMVAVRAGYAACWLTQKHARDAENHTVRMGAPAAMYRAAVWGDRTDTRGDAHNHPLCCCCRVVPTYVQWNSRHRCSRDVCSCCRRGWPSSSPFFCSLCTVSAVVSPFFSAVGIHRRHSRTVARQRVWRCVGGGEAAVRSWACGPLLRRRALLLSLFLCCCCCSFFHVPVPGPQFPGRR